MLLFSSKKNDSKIKWHLSENLTFEKKRKNIKNNNNIYDFGIKSSIYLGLKVKCFRYKKIPIHMLRIFTCNRLHCHGTVGKGACITMQLQNVQYLHYNSVLILYF